MLIDFSQFPPLTDNIEITFEVVLLSLAPLFKALSFTRKRFVHLLLSHTHERLKLSAEILSLHAIKRKISFHLLRFLILAFIADLFLVAIFIELDRRKKWKFKIDAHGKFKKL